MTPRQRPPQRDDLTVETTLKRAAHLAPEIELGWSQLRQAMRDVGWPSRSPSASRPVVVPRCLDCLMVLKGSSGKDRHQDQTGHTRYDMIPTPEDSLDSSSIDYADPTGDLAGRLDNLADDLDAMQFRWHRIQTDLRVMASIARKHQPVASASEPACWYTTCDGTVEQTPNGGYRGMERIGLVWVAKPGVHPVCARHRRIAGVA
jgi:hypothetical protein